MSFLYELMTELCAFCVNFLLSNDLVNLLVICNPNRDLLFVQWFIYNGADTLSIVFVTQYFPYN